ncbi:MAG: diaminopimelate epimerase [bacterium]|nr:diaminopimelate epimerase [bacterium]
MSKRLPFFKMSACGNDFILIDNRQNLLDKAKASEFVQQVCRRRIAVGADGVIFLRQSQVADFGMVFFNADGREVEMCGNGARCLARFAYLNDVCTSRMTFETQAGLIEAEVDGQKVKLKMDYLLSPKPPFPLMVNGKEREVFFLKVGVPHAVYLVEDLEQVDVIGLGRATRYHPHFQPQGTNANFVQVLGPHKIAARTYERGVEDETLACGTGSVASSIICAHLGLVVSPVSVVTRSGCVLKVYYKEKSAGEFGDIYLQGEARVVAEGNLWLDELRIEESEIEESE